MYMIAPKQCCDVQWPEEIKTFRKNPLKLHRDLLKARLSAMRLTNVRKENGLKTPWMLMFVDHKVLFETDKAIIGTLQKLVYTHRINHFIWIAACILWATTIQRCTLKTSSEDESTWRPSSGGRKGQQI